MCAGLDLEGRVGDAVAGLQCVGERHQEYVAGVPIGHDEMSGQAVVAFVILRESAGDGGEGVVKELRDHVAKEIGAIAKPKSILVVAELPKTRSGKIMRRLLKDVAEHREVGDVTTLADDSVMQLIEDGMKKGTDED